MRLFVAIPLPDSVACSLTNLVARLRGTETAGDASPLRWTAPDSWHITLQFLGNATREQSNCLKSRLSEVRSKPFPINLGGFARFNRPGVFFLEVLVTPPLAALERSIVAATSPCGFAAEPRPFRPHITLARAKGQGRGSDLRALETSNGATPAFNSFMATEFVLYESHLGTDRARYQALLRVPLARG